MIKSLVGDALEHASSLEDNSIDLIIIDPPYNTTIYDCFMGTGSTLLAASNLNRNAIGVDTDPDFVKYFDESTRKRLDTIRPGVVE